MKPRVRSVLLAEPPGSLAGGAAVGAALARLLWLFQPSHALPWDSDSSIQKKSFAGSSWLFPLWANWRGLWVLSKQPHGEILDDNEIGTCGRWAQS